MVARETHGVKAIREAPNPNGDERQFSHDTPRANRSIWRREFYVQLQHLGTGVID